MAYHLFMRRHILDSSQVNNPLMRFIDPNWDPNSTHESQSRVSEIHDIKLLGLGTRLGYSLTCFSVFLVFAVFVSPKLIHTDASP